MPIKLGWNCNPHSTANIVHFGNFLHLPVSTEKACCTIIVFLTIEKVGEMRGELRAAASKGTM
jgi:hypothetical protein